MIPEEECPEGFWDSWTYEDDETGETVVEGYCDYRCFRAGGVYEEYCYDYEGEDGTMQVECYDTCSFGEDNELCLYPYISSWSGESVCDVYCEPNSGVLDADEQCQYENMDW